MLNLEPIRIAVATTFAATLLTVNPLQAADDWFEQQRSISDGYSPPALGVESRYVGATLETSPQDEFLQGGLRITDGTTEYQIERSGKPPLIALNPTIGCRAALTPA